MHSTTRTPVASCDKTTGNNTFRRIKDASNVWAADNIAVVMAAVWLLTGAALSLAYEAGYVHGTLGAQEQEVVE